MRRVVLSLAVVAASALVAAAAPAGASPSAHYGIQDDAWLLYGPGTVDSRVARLEALGVRIVRFTLRWDEIAATKPASPRNPDDPAYAWAPYDAVLHSLQAHGIPALVTLWGSPPWANGGRSRNWVPTRGSYLADFAYAASERYPWVRMWTVWNEPNGPIFMRPVSPALYVQRLLNPAYAALHAANSANRVAGGVTSPRRSPSGMSPLTFMRGMRAAHARLDAYAQNPYPTARGETPFRTPCGWCSTFTMARLPQIRADVTREFGSKPLWLTEYGYQTNPPDRLLGVAPALQAAYIGAAALRVYEQPGVDVLIQFLVQDEPGLGGWQSGLLTVRGTPKPAYHAFALPLAEVARSGSRAKVWGQVRPRGGSQPYVLQRWSGNRWLSVGGTSWTGAGGSFERVVAASRGTKLRLWSPRDGFAGAPIVVA